MQTDGGDPSAAPIWILLGARHGDNQQLVAIADALRLPYRAIGLRFNALARLAPPLLLAHSRASWRADAELAPPWPKMVLAAGRKSVPAALWIRRRSAGRTRLVHVNRPWAPLAWFDLVVTTAQYALPARVNVVTHLLPFVPVPAPVPWPSALAERAAALPRPWTAVLLGGASRPCVFDDDAAARLGALVEAEVRAGGGSAWLLESPRTPRSATTLVEHALSVPAHVARWGDGANPYRPLLVAADRFVVTADSASMLAEALLTGRPVTPFELPTRPDWRWRIATAWRTAAARAPSSLVARGFAAALDLGVVSSVRDIGLLRRALCDAGVFEHPGRALEHAERERAATLARITALLDSAPVPARGGGRG